MIKNDYYEFDNTEFLLEHRQRLSQEKNSVEATNAEGKQNMLDSICLSKIYRFWGEN